MARRSSVRACIGPSLRGVCADPDKRELLSGDVDGDGEPEIVVRSVSQLYSGVESGGGPGEHIGHAEVTTIATRDFVSRARVTTRTLEDDAGFPERRVERRIGFIDMNGDDHVDLFLTQVDAWGCAPGEDLWADGEWDEEADSQTRFSFATWPQDP